MRQALDQFVDAGHLRGLDHVVEDCGVELREAGDVLRDGTGEELDVLRQVTDVTASVLRAHSATFMPSNSARPPDGRQAPARTRARLVLPAALGPISAIDFTRLELEVDAFQDELAWLPTGERDVLGVEPTLRARQRQDWCGLGPLAGDGD